MDEELKNKNPNFAADEGLKLSIERTELALERTHLAWTRTVVTLIASGFAIDKIAETFHQNRLETGKALLAQSHVVSLVMLVGAVILLIFDTLYYIKRSGELASMKNEKRRAFPTGIILSVIILCVGLLLIFYSLFSG